MEYFTHSEFNFQVQTLEIEIAEDSFVGMPFVLLSQGNWIKNQGSDFYIEFRVASKRVIKVVFCCNPNRHFFLQSSCFFISYILHQPSRIDDSIFFPTKGCW